MKSPHLLPPQIQAASDHQKALEAMVKESKATSDKIQKEYNIMAERATKVQREMEEQMTMNQSLMSVNSQKQLEIKVKEEEMQQLRTDINRINKVRSNTSHPLLRMLQAYVALALHIASICRACCARCKHTLRLLCTLQAYDAPAAPAASLLMRTLSPSCCCLYVKSVCNAAAVYPQAPVPHHAPWPASL